MNNIFINSKQLALFIIAFLLLFYGCATDKQTQPEIDLPNPTAQNGGIQLPKDFGATVFHEGIGKAARHVVVKDNGDVYVNLQQLQAGKGVVALRDTNKDGTADVLQAFGNEIGTGIDIHNNYLYASSPFEVFRYPLVANNLLPDTMKVDTIISGFAEQNDHWSKPFTFDKVGNIYVTVGSPSNACQEIARSPGSKGIDPCPQRDLQAGIWRFDANKSGQVHGKDGERYAAGIRNAVGLDWNFQENKLFAMQHGRDQLNQLWPAFYTNEDNAQLPAEEFLAIEQGDDFGWPYCYYDQFQAKKLLSPEYGGDAKQQGRCADIKSPILAFPGHMAPNDLLFYTGDLFPARYKNGAFIAFHGSWNRAPLPQAGFFVVFVPFKDGQPTGDWEVFADGFAGADTIVNPADAKERPMGLAQGPDGALYVTSSVTGKIWKVNYYGTDSEQTKSLATVQQPDKISANLAASTADDVSDATASNGSKVYKIYCLACHQANGKGVQGLNPPLVDTDWVSGDKKRLIGVILNGMQGEKVDGEVYRNIMAPHNFLSDEDIADVLTYIRTSFGNNYSQITKEEVAKERK